MILPSGVVSKNAMGALKTFKSISMCKIRAAATAPYESVKLDAKTQRARKTFENHKRHNTKRSFEQERMARAQNH